MKPPVEMAGRMLDILLVKPPHDMDMATHGSIPLSLAYLAGSLRESFSVEVLDLQFFCYDDNPAAGTEWNRHLLDRLDASRPRIVGITCLFSGDIEKILTISRLVKTHSPSAKIIVGGVHPTIFCHEILTNCRDIDFIVKGEGERTSVELVRAVKEGRTDYSHIDGLAWRNAANEVTVQDKTRYIEDLDSLPAPAYDLFPMDRYTTVGTLPNPKKHRIRMNFPIITSRSCGRSCNFCSLHNAMGRKSRTCSAEKVLDNIEHLYHAYGVNYFDIEDDNFTVSKRRVMDICDGLKKRKLDIQFRLRNGVYIPSIDREVAAALADAGLVLAYMAIESGSDYIRNRIIGKNVPAEKIHECAEAFARHPQVTLGAFFIVGMPEETNETIAETMKMIDDLPLDLFMFMPATPYPGTRLYDQCVRDRLFTLDDGRVGQLWRRSCRIEQTISSKNPILVKPYNMRVDELERHCRTLAGMGSQVMLNSLKRRNRGAVEKVQGQLREAGGGGRSKMYVFGAGIYGRLGRRLAEDAGLAVAGFFDNNNDLWGKDVDGIAILPPRALPGMAHTSPTAVFICVLNRADALSIDAAMKSAGVEATVLLADHLQI